MKHSKNGTVLGATLVIAFAVTLVVAGLIKWVDTERRTTQRHVLNAKARYAAEAVNDYGAAQVRTVLEKNPIIVANQFTPAGTMPLVKPTAETLDGYAVNLASEIAQAKIIPPGQSAGVARAQAAANKLIRKAAATSAASGAGEPARTSPNHVFTSDELVAGAFNNTRWEVVTASSPLYVEDPLRGQKILLREMTILSQATVASMASDAAVTAYAEQVLQVRDTPLFSYALFYNMDLEVMPGPQMDIWGPVHGNCDIYLTASSGLYFRDIVTAGGKIFQGRIAGDTSVVLQGPIHFLGEGTAMVPMMQEGVWVDSKLANWAERASQLWKGNVRSQAHGTPKANPPGTTSYVPDDPLTVANELQNSARILIEPALKTNQGGYPGNEVETQKLATKACLVFDVAEDGSVKAYKYVSDPNGKYARNLGSGVAYFDRKELSVPTGLVVGGVASNKFYDMRRARTIQVLDIDIGVLKNLIENDAAAIQWTKAVTTFSPATEWNGVVYVKHANTTSGAVRLVNGRYLPSRPTSANGDAKGFTLATNVPAYIRGNYNADGAFPASSSGIRAPDSALEPPAAVMADAVTILSNAWNDANSTLSLSSRVASQTEVAAALVTGIVPTNKNGNGTYSGGVENLPRFLENWGGVNLGYRGSLVVLFESTIATEPWGASNVYGAPVRVWGFSTLFADGVFPPGRMYARSYRRLSYRTLTAAEYTEAKAALPSS